MHDDRTFAHSLLFRTLRGRKLSGPSPVSTVSFLFAIVTSCYVLSSISLRQFSLEMFALPFAIWLAVSLLTILGEPLRVDEDLSLPRRVYNIGSTLTETIVRKGAVALGFPIPFDVKLERLKESCQAQYRKWQVRISLREYYRSLRRKKITYDTCTQLLDTFAMWNSNEDIQEGVLPGNLDEAAAFLKLEIDDSIDEPPMIQEFYELADCVESHLKFKVGDRVMVQSDNQGDSYNHESVSNARSTEIVSAGLGSRNGSVVRAYPLYNLVHFDGQDSPIIVLASSCKHWSENENLSDGDDGTVVSGGGAAISHHSTVEESLDSKSSSEEDDEEAKAEPPERKRKARTVQEALLEGWTLRRKKNHIHYKRRIFTTAGHEQTQSFTMAKTPSDHRAYKNALSMLNRLNAAGTPLDDPSSKTLVCSMCGMPCAESGFSKTQIKKRIKKCKSCAENMELQHRQQSSKS